MKEYEVLGKEIIRLVGGEENIKGVKHCITRLRFNLKDIKLAQTSELEKLDKVINVLVSGGQYQIVIGNDVDAVYKGVAIHLKDIDNFQVDYKESMTFLENFVDILSTVFSPLIGILSATGIIKGVSILFIGLGLLTQESGTFIILQMIGDSLLVFSPIYLGYTAAKRFGMNPFTGMAIGATLVHPNIATIMSGEAQYLLFPGTVIESSVYTTFLTIPVMLMSYAGSSIPAVFAVYVGSKIEKFIEQKIPSVVRMFIVPAIVLLITVPLTFIIIGPIAIWIGNILAAATGFIYELSPIATGALVGALWQVFVLFGLHYALMPISLNAITTIGYDNIISARLVSIFAVFGVAMAIYFKNKKQKKVALPAAISAFFGITEPAIYGLLVPVKNAFLATIIAGTVGGAIAGIYDVRLYTQGGLGILAIPSYLSTDGIDQRFIGLLISILVSMVLGFVLMLLLSKKENDITDDNDMIIKSPIKGDYIKLSDVEDEVFSSKMMGEGYAIQPQEGRVIAPFNGQVTSLFPTLHAIGLTSDNGVELLIHIGLETVNLDGKYFNTYVKQGDKISIGDPLIDFNIKKIEEKGYSLVTPIIITNTDRFSKIRVKDVERLEVLSEVIELE